ncbi:hypothetical protein ACIBL5_37685 [Streptomyces sp. NPDC050516]|uniref:hypothetical protein n=1 Tax=Streptomyces sp. NPDC050516 TaxID=3365621 RepID=UPI0037B95B64
MLELLGAPAVVQQRGDNRALVMERRSGQQQFRVPSPEGEQQPHPGSSLDPFRRFGR